MLYNSTIINSKITCMYVCTYKCHNPIKMHTSKYSRTWNGCLYRRSMSTKQHQILIMLLCITYLHTVVTHTIYTVCMYVCTYVCMYEQEI